jgi:hypothetical protein
MRQDEMRAIGEPRAMAASVKKKALPGRLECVSKGNGPRDVEEAAGEPTSPGGRHTRLGARRRADHPDARNKHPPARCELVPRLTEKLAADAMRSITCLIFSNIPLLTGGRLPSKAATSCRLRQQVIIE